MVLIEDLFGKCGVLDLLPWIDGFDRGQGIVEDEGAK
jgi:hypothetical protein